MTEQEMIDAISNLIGDNLLLQAQFTALKSVSVANAVVLMKDYPEEVQKEIRKNIEDSYNRHVQTNYESLLVNHPYLSAYWKNKLQNELGDCGVFFPSDLPG